MDNEYKEALKLVLGLLENRLEDQPLSDLELQAVDDFNKGCILHYIPDLRYCKACQGIIVAITCQEGGPTSE